MTDVNGAILKPRLHGFVGHPWTDCSVAVDGRRGVISEDQLGAGGLSFSKIGDGSAERTGRPLGTAVFDFRFRARYEP